MNSKTSLLFTVLAAFIALAVADDAPARTFTWRNPEPTGEFESVFNWQASGISPGVPSGGDHTVFDSDTADSLEVTTSSPPSPEVNSTSVVDGNFEFDGSRILGDLGVGDLANVDLAELILSGGDQQADEVTINAQGTLHVMGGTFAADTIDDGGTFLLTGGTLNVKQYNGTLDNTGGTVAPGFSPGITVITGDFSQSATSTLAIDIGGLNPGTGHDQIQVGGDVQLDGTLVVSMFGGFQPALGDSFEIIDVDGALVGNFLGLAEGAIVGNFGGIDLAISYLGGDGNNVVITAIPEPATTSLFAIAAATVLVYRRQRKY